jgi:hypothetical protein
MLTSLTRLLATLGSIFRSRGALQLENLALRYQIAVLFAVGEKTAQADSDGPPVVGLAVLCVARPALACVVTENSVRAENAEVPSIHEILLLGWELCQTKPSLP